MPGIILCRGGIIGGRKVRFCGLPVKKASVSSPGLPVSDRGLVVPGPRNTHIKGVTSDEIASIKVRIPSKLEQDAIVNALERIDQDIGSIEKQYLKSRQIKHGMMQQLLTGKIRL